MLARKVETSSFVKREKRGDGHEIEIRKGQSRM